jgi:hypothetical protein
MVENGELTSSFVPEGSAAADARKEVPKAFDTMERTPANADKQIVLSNNSDQPVQFVEWTVAPAPGAKP